MEIVEIMVDMTDQADNNVRRPTIEGKAMADRLRQALVGKRRSDIIKASGVSDGTITRALRGLPTRYRTLASLADAMHVSIDWLVNGEGPMEYLPVGRATAEGFEVVQGPVMPLPAQHPALFPIINMDRLAEALIASETLFSIQGKSPTPYERAQVQVLMYDMMTREAERKRAAGPDIVDQADNKSAGP